MKSEIYQEISQIYGQVEVNYFNTRTETTHM